MIQPDVIDCATKIKVIGVGGAGGNAVNTMVDRQLDKVEFIAVNTDVMALGISKAHQKIQVGKKLTGGQGCGAIPDRGKKAAEEDREMLESLLDDTHLVILTAGMGGGTGTGAAPVIAQMAKERNLLVIGIVTKPFSFEQRRKAQIADAGVKELRDHVDTLIVIPNDKIFTLTDDQTTLKEAFHLSDSVLYQAVKGISDSITKPGHINVDFEDVKTIMQDAGEAMIGIGVGQGEHRATMAAEQAISCPLLEKTSIEGAEGILFNITGGYDFKVSEIKIITDVITKAVSPEALVIPGMVFDDKMKDEIEVTVIATGFDKKNVTIGEIKELKLKDNEREVLELKNDEEAQEKESSNTISIASKVSKPERVEKEKTVNLDIPTFIRRGFN